MFSALAKAPALYYQPALAKQNCKLFCKWYAPSEAHTQVSLMHVPLSSNQSVFITTNVHRLVSDFKKKLLKMALFLHMTQMQLADLITVDHIYVTRDVQH